MIFIFFSVLVIISIACLLVDNYRNKTNKFSSQQSPQSGQNETNIIQDKNLLHPFTVADDGTIIRKNQLNVDTLNSSNQECGITNTLTMKKRLSTPADISYFCGYCRSRLPEGAKFCPNCGKPVQSHILISAYYDRNKFKDYFRDVLQRHFPQYAIKEEVPVTALSGDIYDIFKLYKERPNQAYKAEWGKPYDFVIYSDEKPKAVVMLGYGNEHNVKVEYLISKMFAKKLHVPYIGFYLKFPNEESYVVNRIKENIR